MASALTAEMTGMMTMTGKTRMAMITTTMTVSSQNPPRHHRQLTKVSPGMPTATNVTAVPSATHRAGDDDGHDSDDDDDNVDDDNDDDDDDDDRTSTVSASATASVSAKETPAIALSPSPSAPARSSASIAAPGASGAPANSAATAQYGVSLLLAAVVLGVAGLNW